MMGIRAKHLAKSVPAIARLHESLTYADQNSAMFANFLEHDRMLADEVRLGPYYEALTTYVNEGDVVLDVGTGTGILAFFAAQRNPSKIYAVDHSKIIEVARELAKRNGIRNIEFVSVHSKEFKPPERIDVIIHEQIGDFLFEEDMISNLVDLRDRVLAPNGKILPSRFEFFVEPVELKDDYRVPFLWEHRNLRGIDYSSLKHLHARKLSKGYFIRSVGPDHITRTLCEPQKLLEFDLMTLDPSQLPREYHYKRPILRDSRLDGLAVYFNVWFDDQIHFGIAPQAKNTNWVGRLLRVESRLYKEGEELEFDLQIDDYANPHSWRWGVA